MAYRRCSRSPPPSSSDREVAVDRLSLQPFNGVARVGSGSLGEFGRSGRRLRKRIQPAETFTEVQVEDLHRAERGREDLVGKFLRARWRVQLLAPLTVHYDEVVAPTTAGACACSTDDAFTH